MNHEGLTSLLITATGRMVRECKKFYSRLPKMISSKVSVTKRMITPSVIRQEDQFQDGSNAKTKHTNISKKINISYP